MAPKGNITPRSFMAPAAAFSMALVLFAYTRFSLREARRNALTCHSKSNVSKGISTLTLAAAPIEERSNTNTLQDPSNLPAPHELQLDGIYYDVTRSSSRVSQGRHYYRRESSRNEAIRRRLAMREGKSTAVIPLINVPLSRLTRSTAEACEVDSLMPNTRITSARCSPEEVSPDPKLAA
ncbi:hypothetical protein F5B20DRAFT_77739 [Whalleya microplaca]|nr:hypothetical protein F5B20DRAFT_77739 [Whalleya microplaca]